MPKIRYSASNKKTKTHGNLFTKKGVSFPLVSGGILHSDETYYYRKFLTSDNLVVTGSLIADILVIAGGGSGGCYGGTGGGGAGTISYYDLQNLSTGSYACQVAAVSGRAGRYDGVHEGNPSQFGSFDSVIGGGQGYSNGYGGGYNGGETRNGGSSERGGGGASGPSLEPQGGYYYQQRWTVGRVGGDGINTYASWASATNTGVDGYYAGGGSAYGCVYFEIPGGKGGGGAGQHPNYYCNGSGDDAVSNTGSGGGSGGNYYYNLGGSGAEGLIIVRYTREQVGG
jgi:hypothetical protein